MLKTVWAPQAYMPSSDGGSTWGDLFEKNYIKGEVWRHLANQERPPTRDSRAERARSEAAGVLGGAK
ncbi:hypothetical protein TYRP_023336 [Tyrophagus putrescentiae]|nr:hypothetical protein TYRP_023336 [Tyrophagus putrescentiae]